MINIILKKKSIKIIYVNINLLTEDFDINSEENYVRTLFFSSVNKDLNYEVFDIFHSSIVDCFYFKSLLCIKLEIYHDGYTVI